MRGRVFLTCLGAALLLGAGCSAPVAGSGKVVTRSVPVAAFSRLEVSNAFTVRVSLATREKLTLRVDDNVVDRLDVGVSNGTLRIGLKSGTSVLHANLRADVSARALVGIQASGAAQVHLSKELTGRTLGLGLSGAARLDGTVRVDAARAELSGASRLTLVGTAGRLAVADSGASQLDAQRLRTAELTIDLSGASQATATVTGTVSAQLSGASRLRYRGSPRFVRRSVSGGSSIEPL